MSTKKNSSAVTLPSNGDVFTATVDVIKERSKELLLSFMSILTRQERVSAGKTFGGLASLPQFNKKKALRLVVPIVLVMLLALITFALIKKATAPQSVAKTSASSVISTAVNREFKFPLKDANGKKMGEFSYNIKSAEKRHQIVVKGQNATSVAGRVFLIINLQIVNTLNQGLQINTRDYIRISVNGKTQEWFAPDVHNDPVEAQAISTTNTRLGLAINDSDRDISLQVGEINGKKVIIPLSFKN